MLKRTLTALAVSVTVSGTAIAANDFGAKVEMLLKHSTLKYFGFHSPLSTSASDTVTRTDGQVVSDLIDVATGLNAQILTRRAGNKADMFAFWPDDSAPSHLIFCIEGGVEDLSGTVPGGSVAKLNPLSNELTLTRVA